MQNAPTNCANKPDAEVGINFIITNQKKKGREGNAIDPTRYFKNSTQFSIEVFFQDVFIIITIIIYTL